MAIQQLAATTWSAKSTVSILGTCVPWSARLDELIKVFLRYMDEHPERGHERFSDVALSALWAAYPCRPNAKPPP